MFLSFKNYQSPPFALKKFFCNQVDQEVDELFGDSELINPTQNRRHTVIGLILINVIINLRYKQID